jgi:hypothetical protein
MSMKYSKGNIKVLKLEKMCHMSINFEMGDKLLLLMDTSFMDDTILCQWIKSNDRSNILIE